MMIKWIAVLYGLLAAALVTGGAYVKGRADGRQLEVAERATLDEVARVSREEGIAAAAEAIAKISVKHTTIRHQAEVQIREREVYRECRTDDVTGGLLDAARANRPAPEPAGDRGVSGAGTGQP